MLASPQAIAEMYYAGVPDAAGLLARSVDHSLPAGERDAAARRLFELDVLAATCARPGDPTACSTCGGSTCAGDCRALISYSFDQLLEADFPQRPALLCAGEDAILRAGNLSMVYAPRGMGKSLFAVGRALAVATGGRFLRWHAPEARGVLVVDGELPGWMLKARFAETAAKLGIRSAPLLRVVGADWQRNYLPRLDTIEGQELLEPLLEGVSFVVLDNASCLFDPESEKDPSAWAPAQAWLLSLRRRGIASEIIHHANRLGGARGHSKREDLMDAIIKLTRPADYQQEQGARFVVEFDKSRSFWGDAAAPFVCRFAPDEIVVEGEPGIPPRDAELRAAVLAYIGANPGATKGLICGNVTGREQAIRRLVDDLGEQGVLRKSDGRWWLA